jgi:hypothetical protein
MTFTGKTQMAEGRTVVTSERRIPWAKPRRSKLDAGAAEANAGVVTEFTTGSS